MIVKRLAQAIKQQNWFTVLIELVTIVIGIFVGLQVDAWNDARLRQRNVEFQLTRIEQDAKALFERLGNEIDVLYRQLELLSFTLSVIDGAPLTDDNRREFVTGLVTSYQQRTVNLDIPSLQLLYDTGDIDLIPDDKVRDTLLTHLLLRRTGDEIFTHQRRLWDMNLETVFQGFTFDVTSLDPAARSVRTELEFDIDKLRGDIEFRGALGRVARMEIYTLDTLRGMRENVGQIVSALENRYVSTD